MRSATVTIVRHGETEFNNQKIVQGWLDTPLNAQGEAQAKVLAKFFRKNGIRFDTAWSSDLSRARKTAEIVMADQDFTDNPTTSAVLLQEDERLRERNLGNYQGKRRGDPEADPKTIEPTIIFRNRLVSFWDSVFGPKPSSSNIAHTTQINGSDHEKILLVSHGGSIRQLVESLFMLRPTYYQDDWSDGGMKRMDGSVSVKNCSVTTFQMERMNDGDWRGVLVGFSDDRHFDDSSRVPSPSANVDVID